MQQCPYCQSEMRLGFSHGVVVAICPDADNPYTGHPLSYTSNSTASEPKP